MKIYLLLLKFGDFVNVIVLKKVAELGLLLFLGWLPSPNSVATLSTEF